MPSPLVVGIFEAVMMRTGDDLHLKKWAELLHEYMHGDDGFYAANCAHGEQVFVMKTLPHEEVILPSEYVEVLDHDKAVAIIEKADRFAMGVCSCRHEKMHLGQKRCDVPLELCSSFGPVADSLIRHGFAKEVSKSEVRENLARAKELKLTLAADNVKTRVNFICYCCKCCCNLMSGVSKHGFPNTVMTSNFLSQVNPEKCKGCGKCADSCPVDAIKLMPRQNPESEAKKIPGIQADLCLGCGVCGLACPSGAMALVQRKQRVIQPETTFERVILQCLERGTLQNQLFDNPQSLSHKFMRGFVGGFLRLPPVKKALMSDTLRSSFLASMRKGTEKQGKGWLLEI
jgi:NAD-dependent dihydropyrimidine dehydrogenase PreA subunit